MRPKRREARQRKALQTRRFIQNGEVASSSKSGSTVAGSILAVCDQNGAKHDNEMRLKYVVLSKTAELRERQGAARAHTESM